MDDVCQKMERALVTVVPINVYGWSRYESIECRDFISTPVPSRFQTRVCEFYRVNNVIVGGSGLVEEEGYPLDNMWVSFWLRDGKGEITYDMTTEPGTYHVCQRSPKVHHRRSKLAGSKCTTFWG